MKCTIFASVAAIVLVVFGAGAAPVFESQDIFTPQEKHVHGSSIVEAPNGDFLTTWFHGSGERTADDVQVNGARLNKNAEAWSSMYLMADTPGIPDCNPVLDIDQKGRLWLYWIAVVGNRWETSLLKYRRSDDYLGEGAPNWTWQDVIVLKPGDDFGAITKEKFKEIGLRTGMWGEYGRRYEDQILEACEDKTKRRSGWMTRIHPLTLPSGRILLPLYSDGYNASLVAISDDMGETWRSSKPIIGFAPIQPALARRNNGDIVAYMRDSGGAPNRVMKSVSTDDGESWSAAVDTVIFNPGSSLDVINLKDGSWLMVANDTERGRHQLTALLSEDEGETWPVKRQIESIEKDGKSFGYPSVIQAQDGLIHMTYTRKSDAGKTIRHTIINTEWICAEK